MTIKHYELYKMILNTAIKHTITLYTIEVINTNKMSTLETEWVV